jgi:hypothetical protein
VATKAVLDVPSFSKESGTHIQQWSSNGGVNQAWTLSPSDGTGESFEIISSNSGMVLDVPHSAFEKAQYIQQWPLNGGGNQQWNLMATPTVSTEGQHTQTAGQNYLTTTGSGFAPGTTVEIAFMGRNFSPPDSALQGGGAVVAADGTFSVRHLIYAFPQSSTDPQWVTVCALDISDLANQTLVCVGSVESAWFFYVP